MGQVVLITGGAKSGKSAYALSRARADAPEEQKRYFLATARAVDEEMRDKIRRHQEERDGEYETLEAPLDLAEAMQNLAGGGRVIIVLDCLTVWLGNLYYEKTDDEDYLARKISQLAGRVQDFKKRGKGRLYIITNELGGGIVPADRLSRSFRDRAGLLNQRMAVLADEVVLCVCGLPQKLKG